MRVSHLTDRLPTTPGTTARRGNPWSLGMGSPFICRARTTSCSADTALQAGTEAPYGEPPSSVSAPSICTCRSRSRLVGLVSASARPGPAGDPAGAASALAPAAAGCTETTASSSRGRPAARSTSLRRGPRHTAFPMAARSQSRPCTLRTRDISRRLFPPHCSVTSTSTCSKLDARSSKVKVTGDAIPLPSTVSTCVAGSTSGTARWLRT
mmetsp:Transcript_9324/g.36411  ORF Transcript_9324/g.36411 Transcript_9324/m.36411 type:complete len:210 (-) Transcript_9324:727-1356(-)